MKALTPDETILGLIAIQTYHGYELIETFRRSEALGEVWKMSTSQIYAVLKRLEQQALINGRVVESNVAPRRTEYHLTLEGEKRLQAWLHEPQPSASIRRVRVEFLSRLFIANQLNIPTLPIVQRQRAVCQAERQILVEALKEKSRGMGYLAQELVIAQLDAVLSWIARCERVAEDMEDQQ